ncbi:hypothetical protein [Myxococcus xanthus]|uniref:hypothetical protein n=1 Tax=Myxococcus xanthus TaxID=34 RepID=UPI00112D24D9|nr:hypothetical protein [Myxococcus xanthus]QDF03225.1 hypothetical protein BHS04_08335 [Myxococcus xanthus]
MNPFPTALKRQDYIQEGANPASGAMLLACTVGDDDDVPKSRVIVVRDGLELAFSFSGDAAVSIDAAAKGPGYVLGENGTVIRFDWRGATSAAELEQSRRSFSIPAVEDLGPLRRLRLLGRDLVCAGSVGQVYQLVGDRFTALPRLTIDGEDVTIEDIAGPSATDMIAVTSDGHGARFDGEAWHKLALTGSSSLNCACRLPRGRYAIAGDNATLWIGSANKWQAVPAPQLERDYTGIAADGATLYLAHLGGIDVYEGGAMRPMKIPSRRRNEFVVLRSGPDGIGSFAGRSVGLIAAGQWQVMV